MIQYQIVFWPTENNYNIIFWSDKEYKRQNERIYLCFNAIKCENRWRKGKSWEFDFSKQFPISHVDIHDDKAIVTIGAPHLNSQIITHVKRSKMDGESTLISDKKNIIATLTFVDGYANGPCTLFDVHGIHSLKEAWLVGMVKAYERNMMRRANYCTRVVMMNGWLCKEWKKWVVTVSSMTKGTNWCMYV